MPADRSLQQTFQRPCRSCCPLNCFAIQIHTLPGILFICSMNRWRSPTAEQIFAVHPGIPASRISACGLHPGYVISTALVRQTWDARPSGL